MGAWADGGVFVVWTIRGVVTIFALPLLVPRVAEFVDTGWLRFESVEPWANGFTVVPCYEPCACRAEAFVVVFPWTVWCVRLERLLELPIDIFGAQVGWSETSLASAESVLMVEMACVCLADLWFVVLVGALLVLIVRLECVVLGPGHVGHLHGCAAYRTLRDHLVQRVVVIVDRVVAAWELAVQAIHVVLMSLVPRG